MYDEAAVRNELTRTFDTCTGCRRCVDLCSVFPSLFELVERFDDRDTGRLTPAEQDAVIDACFQCGVCALECPFELDVPRLIQRTGTMRLANGQIGVRERIATRAIAQPGRLARIGSLGVTGSAVRKLAAAATGVSAVRMISPRAKQRFSTWFRARTPAPSTPAHGRVVVFPTCHVEYQAPEIGKALVAVYERNGVECTLTTAGCCGAPWLHAGDVARFGEIAERNSRTLAREVEGGAAIVVPQPTCAMVIGREYDAQVAGVTHDACGYLVERHASGDLALDLDFAGDVPERITYHVACHLRVGRFASDGRDLLALTGAMVTDVEQCAGSGSGWGLRATHERAAMAVASALAKRVEGGTDDGADHVVVGDCGLANAANSEQASRLPKHPLALLAQAYGITV